MPGLIRCLGLAALTATMGIVPRARADWKPAEAPLMTRWARDVSPDRVHPEYPRPQMVRSDWTNLNGLWDYAIRPRDENRPDDFDGQILVPFPVESALSGVLKPVGEPNRLWYRRDVEIAPPADGGRLLLHFGAVDWQATVWVNGTKVGEHKGGYDPFTFDITDALKDEGPQELVVAVWDPTDKGSQARGKQVVEPEGIWYTAVTGIWQTAWLEPVPAASVEGYKAVPDLDAGVLRLTVEGRGTRGTDTIRAVAKDGENVVARVEGAVGDALDLEIADAKLWSPESPFLYDLDVTLLRDGEPIDAVGGYFGMRSIAVGKDDQGFERLLLNGTPLFQYGPLDQGWWPDGLYTAPTDEALKYDLEVTRRLGFNMLRKHVKVEPARFYHHCDRMGLLVWQDMPSGFDSPALRVGPADTEDVERDPESAAQFEAELKAMIESLQNHPSIVMWVPFNEGWGQYETARIARMVKEHDPSRLVNATSGWTDRNVGDVRDVHMYPGPGIEPAGPGRSAVLGEFGGLGLPVEGHLWWNKRNWGYRTYQTREELQGHYRDLLEALDGLPGLGLSAAVYTQTTDVEGEVNGLMTYDREVLKFDPEDLRSLHSRLSLPAPKASVLLDDSEFEPQSWRFTTRAPADGWQRPDFDDNDWKEGDAPFARHDTHFFPSGTPWTTGEIWLRKAFTIDGAPRPDDLQLKVYHVVGRATVTLNGNAVAELTAGTRRHYGHVDIREHRDLLRPGRNVIAIHAVKAEGARAIDLGLYSLGDRRP